MIKRILASSRFFIAVAVLGSFVASVVLLVYGAVAVGRITVDVMADGMGDVEGAKVLSVQFIELIDVFLLGTVLYIVALGLYQLFVDPALPLPAWLRISNLEELKANLIGVIIVLLGVTFLGYVVTWDGDDGILALGAAVALVIGTLSIFFVAIQRHLLPHAPKVDGG